MNFIFKVIILVLFFNMLVYSSVMINEYMVMVVFEHCEPLGGGNWCCEMYN